MKRRVADISVCGRVALEVAGTKIALDDANKANWHMHAVLYGLIKLLMDDVLGQPAENEQQVRINVLDAPTPERVGIPAFIDIGP
jgi:hypothetical protein